MQCSPFVEKSCTRMRVCEGERERDIDIEIGGGDTNFPPVL